MLSVITHIPNQCRSKKNLQSFLVMSGKLKTSKSFRIIGSAFFGNPDVLVHTAIFSPRWVFTTCSTTKGLSAGLLLWYFFFVDFCLSKLSKDPCSSKATCPQISKNCRSIAFLTLKLLCGLPLFNVALMHRK